MKDSYDLHIRIPLSKVATIIEVLQGEGVLLNIGRVEDKPHNSGMRHYTHRMHGEVTGYEFSLAFMNEREEFRPRELEKAFRKDGRNGKSASPIISKLVKEGKLARANNGYLKVVK